MAMVWFDQDLTLPIVTEILNYVFMVIFSLEALIKIIALKKAYFRDTWNIFDFTIVFLTLAILIFKVANFNIQFAGVPTILRVLRIGRILRLIKQAE